MQIRISRFHHAGSIGGEESMVALEDDSPATEEQGWGPQAHQSKRRRVKFITCYEHSPVKYATYFILGTQKWPNGCFLKIVII